MEIKVRAVLDIAAALGAKEQVIEVPEGLSLHGLVHILCERHGERLSALLLASREPMELTPELKVYINGRGSVFLDGFATVLHAGDDVVFMPQVSGG